MELTDFTLRVEKRRRNERIASLKLAVGFAKKANSLSHSRLERRETELLILNNESRLFRLEGIEIMHNLKAEEAKKKFGLAGNCSKRLGDPDGVIWCEAAIMEADAEKFCGDYVTLSQDDENKGNELLVRASSKFEDASTRYGMVSRPRNVDETSIAFCKGMRALCLLLAVHSEEDPAALYNVNEWEARKKEIAAKVPEFFEPKKKDTLRSQTRLGLLLSTRMIPKAEEFETRYLKRQIEMKGDLLSAQSVRRYQERALKFGIQYRERKTLGDILHEISGTPQPLFDLNSAWNIGKHYEVKVVQEGKANVDAEQKRLLSILKPMILDGTLDTAIQSHDGLVKRALGL